MLTVKNETFDSGQGNLSALLSNVQSVIDEKMGIYNNFLIVEHNPQLYYPMVYISNISGQTIINLGTYAYDWSRYIFQFAHEYCHIRTNFQIIKYQYQWLEEVFSHMASHYVLIELSEKWKTKPPFLNWIDYANHLKIYSDNIINKINIERNSIDLINVKNSLFENGFNYNDKQRMFFEIKCLKILPLFQKDENYWKALSYWNQWEIESSDMETDVLAKWYETLPKDLKYVVDIIYVNIEP